MQSATNISYIYVDTDATLEILVSHLQHAEIVALDTETDGLHHYHIKVCLIQITINDVNYILDPLAGLDLGPFLEALADKPLVIHGANYDLRMLRSLSGFVPRNRVYDTMLAGQLLGFDQLGLMALAQRILGVAMTKHARKSNWAQRPLTQAQLDYAMEDTRHLVALLNFLLEELGKLGRLGWYQESCEQIVQIVALETPKEVEDPWRFKGTGLLDRQEMAYAREIWYWREEEASHVDMPPFKIMGPQQILRLAIWAVTSGSETVLDEFRLPRHCKGRRMQLLEEAMKRAREMPKAQWPKRYRPKPVPIQREPGYRRRVETLMEECMRIAGEIGIGSSVLASRAALEKIARFRPRNVKELISCSSLMRWQAELIEPRLRHILDKPTPGFLSSDEAYPDESPTNDEFDDSDRLSDEEEGLEDVNDDSKDESL